MANYYETARTNYFRVKDMAKFEEFINSISGTETYKDEEGRVCVLFTEDGVPSSRYNETTEDWDGEFDQTHTGEIELPTPTEDDRKAMFERYVAQPNPLAGKTVIGVQV